MLALYITGSILLLFTLIMFMPIILTVDYKTDEKSDLKIRLAVYELFKPKKLKNQKIKGTTRRGGYQSSAIQTASESNNTITPKSRKTATKKSTPKREKNPLADIDLKIIKAIYNSLKNPFKRLIKKVKIKQLRIDNVVGGSDAAMAAINFGLQSAVVHGGLAWFKSITSVKVESVNIYPDFMSEKNIFAVHFKAKIKIGTLLIFALLFIIKIMKHREKIPVLA